MNVLEVVKEIAFYGKDGGNGGGKDYTKIKGVVYESKLPAFYIKKSYIVDDNGNLPKGDFIEVSFELGNEDEIYVFGNDIVKIDKIKSLKGAKGRYKNKNYSAYLIATWFNNIGEKIVDYKWNVVSGVPSEFSNEEDEKDLEKAFLNLSTVYVNGKKYVIDIENVKIVPQPLGTLMDLVLDENGFENERYDELMNDYLGILDFGEGTTEGEVVNLGALNVNDRTTIPKAMGDIKKPFIKFVKKKYGVNLGDIDLSLDFIPINKNTRYDYVEEREKALSEFSEEVITEIKEIDSFERFSYLFLCGGGSIPLEKHIKEKFGNDETINNIIIERVENPQFSNARGFYKIALYYFEEEESNEIVEEVEV